MPAKAKVTKEMIVDAAFAIAREAGVENINARTVSERLHCSTPVSYTHLDVYKRQEQISAISVDFRMGEPAQAILEQRALNQIGVRRERPELKHLSRARKRHQPRFR